MTNPLIDVHKRHDAACDVCRTRTDTPEPNHKEALEYAYAHHETSNLARAYVELANDNVVLCDELLRVEARNEHCVCPTCSGGKHAA